MPRLEFTLAGMHCDACVARLRSELAAPPGIRVDQLDVNRLAVEADDAAEAARRVTEAVRRAGFSVVNFRSV